MTIAIPHHFEHLPPPIAPGGANLEPIAKRFAGMTRDEAEALIDAYVGQAIARWKIADATFWQRVRFRSRLIRATVRRGCDDVDGSQRQQGGR